MDMDMDMPDAWAVGSNTWIESVEDNRLSVRSNEGVGIRPGGENL